MKSVMNKFFFILILALGTAIPSEINATHIVGGDISYRCLGNDFYEVTLTLRRDCINGAEDAPFDEQAAVGIFDKTGRKLDFLSRFGILYMPFMGADTIRSNVPDCALEGDPICVSEAVYISQVYLPFREQGYVLTYQRCCRNGTLNNIINPLETGATRTLCISRESQLECNSGPAFGEFPDIIACANEEFIFDASATDPDGDALTYRLITPNTGASIDYPKPQPPWNPPYNNFVEYADGFSDEDMLGSGSALTIDENTGLITATPSAVGQYLVGIMVEEWKDGVVVGETRRDFEINVRVCGPFPDVAFEAEDNCDGLTLSVTNNTTRAISYVWNFNHPSTDPAFMSTEENPDPFTYTEAGIYTITLEATGEDGVCSVTEEKVVKVGNGLADGLICNEERTICPGDNVVIGPVSSSITYEYNPSTGIDLTDPLNPVFSPSFTTVYTVTMTSENGTSSTGTFTVNVVMPFELVIEDVGDVKCESTVDLSATANRDDLTYIWSDTVSFTDTIGTGNSITATMMAGDNMIFVKATSPEGCEEVTNIEIPSSVLTLEEEVSEYNACVDDFATVTIVNLIESQEVTVQWAESSNIISDRDQASIQVVAQGDEESIVLNYTASNDSDCAVEDSVVVEVMRSISAEIEGNNMSCDGTFDLMATSNAPDANFEWSYSSDFDVIISSDSVLQVTLTENSPLFVRASVGENCTSEATSEDLVIRSFDVAFEGVPAEICLGDTARITGTSEDATVVFVFNSLNIIAPSEGQNMVTVGVISGQDTVVIAYTATNDVGCVEEGEIKIPVGQAVQPTIEVVNIDCSNGEVTFQSGRMDETVIWDFGDGGTSTEGDPTHQYASSGTYVVTLSSNTEFCNFDPVTLVPDLVVPELFTLDTITDPSIKYCDNNSIDIAVAVTGNATITWEDGNGNELGTGLQITLTPNGEYDIVRAIATADDPLCGTSMIEFKLSRYVFDITSGEIPAIICPGEEFELSVTDNTGTDLTYEWMPASAVVSGQGTPNATLVVESDTDVTVRVTNEEFMCSHEEVFAIDVPELDLTLRAEPDTEIFLCDEVVIIADPGNFSDYQWSNGDSGPTIRDEPTETTTYTVTITDSNGCTNTGSITINVEVPPCSEEGIFVPNAFTPNNDGNNDLLLVRSNAVKEMDFFVLDRWGNEVFRTTNQRDGWNGKYHNDGRELSSDVYAWCLVATCSDGNDIHLVGNVSLLR